jgi:hypothetical protein
MVHGADSIFAAEDVVIVWGVLRGAAGADGEVVIRIVAAPRFSAVSAEGVDPFAGARRSVAAARSLSGPVDVRRPRADFADFPRLEIHLHGIEGEPPRLTVYYLGVPDTTPEFTTEPALLRYLEATVVAVQPATGQR